MGLQPTQGDENRIHVTFAISGGLAGFPLAREGQRYFHAM